VILNKRVSARSIHGPGQRGAGATPD
jgi:hypothetical protein